MFSSFFTSGFFVIPCPILGRIQDDFRSISGPRRTRPTTGLILRRDVASLGIGAEALPVNSFDRLPDVRIEAEQLIEVLAIQLVK